MRIHKIRIKNFRLLADAELTLEEKTTVIVGRNNSGKTSLSEVMRRLLTDGSTTFQLEDFSSSSYESFIEKSKEFTLVPWRETMDRNLGKSISGAVKGRTISWTLSKARGLSIS